MLTPFIFVLNCGSSSIKFSLLNPSSEEIVLNGVIENVGHPEAMLRWHYQQNAHKKTVTNIDYPAAISAVWQIICENNLSEKIQGIGHRVVHGGERFQQSCLIDDTVIKAIEACCQLAPLHNPANLLGINLLKQQLPEMPQVAVFDTAFHQSMPDYAYRYALPEALYQQHGVRRYGFHGSSHRYVASKAAEILQKDLDNTYLISAHLGNGCSVAAIKQGKSVDTSMGLTPLEGLMMGTRCGDIDPSLPAYLADNLGYDMERIGKLLNQESGLLGLSGISMDMRDLCVAREKGDASATLAIDVFCYRLAKYIAAYTVPLGQLDAVIFTGGIGENNPLIRAKVINRLGLLGFTLDASANLTHGAEQQGLITQPTATKAFVINTNEELLIAQDTLALVSH